MLLASQPSQTLTAEIQNHRRADAPVEQGKSFNSRVRRAVRYFSTNNIPSNRAGGYHTNRAKRKIYLRSSGVISSESGSETEWYSKRCGRKEALARGSEGTEWMGRSGLS